MWMNGAQLINGGQFLNEKAEKMPADRVGVDY